MNVYQSRWGFHPIDYPTYLKLKRLHKAYWEAQRRIGAWRRWSRTLPHTRRGRERGAPAVLWELHERAEIVSDFHNARHGVPREEVKPLALSLAQIDRWLALLAGEDAAA